MANIHVIDTIIISFRLRRIVAAASIPVDLHAELGCRGRERGLTYLGRTEPLLLLLHCTDMEIIAPRDLLILGFH